MRLIDAEQLSKHKYVGIEFDKIEMGIPASAVNVLAYKWGWNDALDSMAENAPTIDPIKHGHWTDRATSIIGVPTEACSVCAEWSIGCKKDYCPNCGAKMDEVEE